MVYDTRSMQKS